jgi:diguanylate cyclase (GGDEF)-like protein
MWNSIRLRYAVLLTLAFLVLGLTAWMTGRSMSELGLIAERVAEQHEILEAEESLLFTLSEFERLRLGYLLSPREDQLEMLLAQRAAASEDLHRLIRAAEHGHLPEASVERVRALLEARFSSEHPTEDESVPDDPPSSRRQALAAREQQIAGELRALISGLYRASRSELARIPAESRAASSASMTRLAVGVLFIAVTLAASAICLFSTLSRVDEGAQSLLRFQRDLLQTQRALRQRSERTSALAELSLRLQACRSRSEVCHVVSMEATALFPETAGGIAVLSDSLSRLEVEVSWGEDAFSERVFTPEDCMALKRAQIVKAGGEGLPARCTHIPHPESHSSICVPMNAQGECYGLLSLHVDTEAPREDESTKAQVDLAAVVAEQIALTLHALRLRANLRNQSVRDPLTGLLNRRHMEETLEREIRRTLRHGRPVGLLMIDLDHFRRHNDAFGHDLGDTTLKEVARMLLRQTRGEDICCRYGGQAFAVILPETSVDLAAECAERVRREAARIALPGDSKSPGLVTVSVGVSACPGHGDTAELLVQAASQALHRSKAEGRNRVTVAEAIIDPDTPGLSRVSHRSS